MTASLNSHRILSAAALLLFATALLQAQAHRPVLEGAVRDAKGTPISGASVRLANNDGTNSQQTTTDANGRFTLESAAAGNYVLRVEKSGFHDISETVTLPFSGTHQCDVVLVPKANANMAAGMEFSDKPDFAVAGVTDWTAAGGHGSDVNLRASEALARDTRKLADASVSSSSPADLQRRRDRLQKELSENDRADLHRQLGDLDEQMNDSLAAVHEYERATELDPSEADYFAWGTELLVHRAVQPAVEIFTKAASSYPRSERMLVGLGAALYSSGLYAEAAERLCAASDLAPRDRTPYLFLGKMLQASSQPLPCSESKLARFVQDEPQDAFANYYYALALWKSASAASSGAASPSGVLVFLENCIKLDPRFAPAHLQMGIIHATRNQIAQAVADYQSAIAADPNLAEAHFRLGQAYKKVGDSAKAREQFEVYERIQKTDANNIEQQRREIQQFVVVFKDRPQVSQVPNP